MTPSRPETPPQRRAALGAALSAMALAACGSGGSSTTASSNEALSGLSLSVSGLSPAFSSTTTSYTLAVANGVTSLTVTPTLADSGATVRVNGVSVASGGTSASISLSVGSNTVSIVTTAADGTTSRTYTVVVTRAAAAATNDASLSALTLSSGSLTPAFTAATTAYAVSVANSVSSVTITATATSSAATVRVNSGTAASGSASGSAALAVGSNTVNVLVTAADGTTTRTYALTVTRSAAGACTLTASETEGPYPLTAILSNSAVVRSDIRETKTGVPLRLTLTLLDLSNGCTPISGAAVYIWHCDKDGLYSGYSVSNNAGQAGMTYLRGVQVTDSNGVVNFTTIYPGWYAGRITHIHVQIFLNNNLGVSATATSQMAFPLDVTTTVYNSSLYTKGQNTSVPTFASDNVFSDGTSTEMLSISGDTASGYDATMTITIA